MFSKLKQFKDLRTQAKKIQSTLGQEVVDISSHGISMKMDGNMELKSVTLEASWFSLSQKEKLEQTLCDVHNDLLKKAQRKMAEIMRATGGLDNLKLPF